MQFAVPQFTEVEDRLIGSLTLKQFLVLLAAGGVILFFWSILGPSIIFFVLSLPIGLFGVGAALGRYNGRAMFTYILPMAAFLSAPRFRIFKREAVIQPIVVGSPKTTTMKGGKTTSGAQNGGAEELQDSTEPAESRLKKLAYLLDSKNRQETDIIGNDQEDAIILPTETPKAHAGPSVLSQLKNSLLTNPKTAAPAKSKLRPAEPMRSVTRQSRTNASDPVKPAASQRKKFDPNSIFN